MLLENEPLRKLRSTAYWKSATEVPPRWLTEKAEASGCHRQAAELTSSALMRLTHCVCVRVDVRGGAIYRAQTQAGHTNCRRVRGQSYALEIFLDSLEPKWPESTRRRR